MMLRLILLFGLLLMPTMAVRAQKPAAPAPAPAPAITQDQARAALEVLNDPKKRVAFTATLQAILQAPGVTQPADGAVAPPAAAKPREAGLPLEPNSLGAQVLLGASGLLSRTADQVMSAAQAIQSVPLLWGWLYVMATNPLGQAVLIDVSWRLLVAVACGLCVEYAVRRSLRRPEARLEAAALTIAREPQTAEDRAEAGDVEAPHTGRAEWFLGSLQRFWVAVGRFGLRILPLLGLLAAGQIVAGSIPGGQPAARLVIVAVLGSYAFCNALIQAARIALEPDAPRLRLVPLGDRPAGYLMRWALRLIVLSVCGYAVAEVGVLLGLSDVAHDALLRTVGLLVTAGLAVMTLRLRQPVRRLLRAPPGAAGLAAVFRDRVAAVWHWVALAVLAALWLVWAADVVVSGAALVRYVGLTLLVLVAAKFVLMSLLGGIDRVRQLGDETNERYPGLDGRLRLYHPALSGVTRGLIYVLAAMTLMQIYGAGALTWLWSTTGGQRIVSGIMSLAVTILVAVAVWEIANAAIQRHLTDLMQDAQLARSSRLRTLLPLFRTTLLITIFMVAILMVLSEIGVNIAPLLAGAGILGVAIGFGSQKLVQDLITGIFLLLENALQVGDAVTVSGLSGSVEGLSVRTIRLRAGDGSIHIIPFSAVTSVTNLSRGVGNAEVRVTVDFEENTDHVAEVLAAIVAEMRAEPDFALKILKDFQLWGVDKVDGAGVTIAGQVVCTDSGRWAVQRAFNRRMKMRFQELDIRFYNQPRADMSG